MTNPRITTSLPPIERGTRLTDYSGFDLTVEGRASGGMGLVVWGADAGQGGQMRAAKLVRPDLLAKCSPAQQAQLRADFEREALTWCHLWPHPAIITAYALTRLPGWNKLPVLMLKYAPGGSLRSWLTQAHQPDRRLPLELAFGWAQQIAAGLAAIHTPDPEHERPDPLVHCDLKPENVLLDADGWARLTDLGLTRAYAASATSADERSAASAAPTAAGERAAEAEARIARMRAALIEAGLRPPTSSVPPSSTPAAPATAATETTWATQTVYALQQTGGAAGLRQQATRSRRIPPLPTASAVGSGGRWPARRRICLPNSGWAWTR